jgi:antitoxin VapB
MAQRTAKVFFTNRSQAIRLPKDFQFNTNEVYISREGEKVILSPKPSSWDDYFRAGPVAPANFMDAVDDMPLQERHP